MTMKGCEWLTSRTNLEKTLMSFSLLLLLTCMIIILVGIVQNSQTGDDSSVCNNKSCIQKAGWMLSMMDLDVDPCEDFYQFSCGRYVKEHAAPDENTVESVDKESGEAVLLQLKNWLETPSENDISVVEKAKTVYKTCMEYDRDEDNVLSVLNASFHEMNVAKWAILEDFWQEKEGDSEKTLASLALLGIPVIFDMKVVPSIVPGNHILKLSPGKPELDTIHSGEAHKNWIQQFVESSLTYLGISKSLTQSRMDDILNVENNFQFVKQKSNKDCGNEDVPELTNDRIESYKNMEDVMQSDLKWNEILSDIFGVLNTTRTTFPVEVYCRRHLRDFNDIPSKVFSYLGWRFFMSIMEYLGPELHWLHLSFQRHFDKQESTPTMPRWRECMNLLEEHMLPVLARQYITQSIGEAKLEIKVKIATGLRNILASHISATKWLSPDEQKRLMQKVKDVKFEIPVPKTAWNMDKVNEWYSNLFVDDDHLALNVLRLRRFAIIQELRQLVEHNMEKLELKVPSLTNYESLSYEENRVAVHFNKLRAPFLCPCQQSYSNYGAFGTFLARELNQYLGSRDLQHLDKNITVWDLFLQSEEGTKCLNMKTEFSPTNIADYSSEKWIAAFTEFSAIRAAYKTYQEHKSAEKKLPGIDLNEDQMFFISYAQSMCEVGGNNRTDLPAGMKVNFALRNLHNFRETFSCAQGSRMHSSETCRVWG